MEKKGVNRNGILLKLPWTICFILLCLLLVSFTRKGNIDKEISVQNNIEKIEDGKFIHHPEENEALRQERWSIIDSALERNINHLVTIQGKLFNPGYGRRLMITIDGGLKIHLLGLTNEESNRLLDEYKTSVTQSEWLIYCVTGFLTFDESVVDPQEFGSAHGTRDMLKPYVQRTFYMAVTSYEKTEKRA